MTLSKILKHYTDFILAYELEVADSIGYDERDSSEFVEIYLKQNPEIIDEPIYTIKPLEFEHIGSDIYSAKSINGIYQVYKIKKSDKDVFHYYNLNEITIYNCDSIEDGVLACNEHLELFMKDGLIEVPE